MADETEGGAALELLPDDLLEKRRRRREEKRALYAGLEARLGIPNGFIDRLIDIPNDWGFIVQTAVLCEAAVTHALVEHARHGDQPAVWYDHFSRLPNNQRLSLAYRLDLFDAKDRNRLGAIATIRNAFAHDVANLGGSLSSFFATCSPKMKVELASALTGEKHEEIDDWSFYVSHIRLLITVGTLGPIVTLAKKGLQAAERDAMQRQWTLANLWSPPDGIHRAPPQR